MRDPSASPSAMLGRAFGLRCPRCGGRGIFASFYDRHERCPTCGLKFEREPGYWVGAVIVVTAITLALFAAIFVGGIVVTWPDVPWEGLAAITIGANLIVPILAYPRAKMTWAALELAWHPLEQAEIDSAAGHIEL